MPDIPLSGLLALPVGGEDAESECPEHTVPSLRFSSAFMARESGSAGEIARSRMCSTASTEDTGFLTARTRAASVRWNVEEDDIGDEDDSGREQRLSAFSMHLARHDLAYTYVLSEKLGTGASAEVWAAEHRLTEEVAAIKMFLSTGSDAIHAAATEFVCAMRSSSPHSLEYRTLAFMDGKPALVMEMAAIALDAWIQERHCTAGAISTAGALAPCGTGDASPKRCSASSDTASALSSFQTESTASGASNGGGPASGSKSRGLMALPAADSCDGESSPHAEEAQAQLRAEWDVQGPPQIEIMNIMSGILEGLTVMHAAGLAHCDLKPANVLLMKDGTAKLADFGAACAINGATGRLAVQGSDGGALTDAADGRDTGVAGEAACGRTLVMRDAAVESLVHSMESKLEKQRADRLSGQGSAAVVCGPSLDLRASALKYSWTTPGLAPTCSIATVCNSSRAHAASSSKASSRTRPLCGRTSSAGSDASNDSLSPTGVALSAQMLGHSTDATIVELAAIMADSKDARPVPWGRGSSYSGEGTVGRNDKPVTRAAARSAGVCGGWGCGPASAGSSAPGCSDTSAAGGAHLRDTMPVRRTICGERPHAGEAPLSRQARSATEFGRIKAYSLREVPMFTSSYSPPERSNACDQRKVDVWAAGCILYELCTGGPLISARTGTAMYALMAQIICDPDWRPPRLPRRSACWQPLLDAALQKDPDMRPLPTDLMTLEIFASLRPRQRSMSCSNVRGLLGSRSFQPPRASTCGGGEWGHGVPLARPSGIADAAFLSESLLRDSAAAMRSSDGSAAAAAVADICSSAAACTGTAGPPAPSGQPLAPVRLHPAKSICGALHDCTTATTPGNSSWRVRALRTSI
eukprot:jgi/Ulvmu1/3928/UM018_0151.1